MLASLRVRPLCPGCREVFALLAVIHAGVAPQLPSLAISTVLRVLPCSCQENAGSCRTVDIDGWFLTAGERGNPATAVDRRRGDGLAWSTGNQVSLPMHGREYFAELAARIPDMQAGDLLLFTDWRGDPDQLTAADGPAVSRLLCAAAGRGVLVRGLIWRSHLDRFQFSEQENRHLGEEVDAAGGQCLLDMRVRPGGSHHMKLMVLRHPGRAALDIAFAGGVDLCHSRRDSADHRGDTQRQPMAAVYGDRPAWHDLQLAIRGPAVGDIEASFRERWADPAPLTMSPVGRLHDVADHQDDQGKRLPAQLPDPEPAGSHAVQILRTYPNRRRGYPFAPDGERSVARGYRKALSRARELIYLEDQYLWSTDVAAALADALAGNPALHLIAVIPRFPDQDGRLSMPPNLIGRVQAIDLLRQAGGERAAVYCLENQAGKPVYVHAKVCVLDDTWAAVGSANLNRRSWTHDSELTCAVLDQADDADRSSGFARQLRGTLSREHLGLAGEAEADLDPRATFAAFQASATALDGWHAGGRKGSRPPGQLRRYQLPELDAWTRAWATPLYKLIYDPDGRPGRMRRSGEF